MKFSRLKRESKLFWPAEVDISDGKLGPKGSAQFPALAKIQEHSEEHQCEINEWHDLFNWCVYVGYHTAAKQRLESGLEGPVKYSIIDWTLVEAHFVSSLHQPGNFWPRRMKRQFRHVRES